MFFVTVTCEKFCIYFLSLLIFTFAAFTYPAAKDEKLKKSSMRGTRAGYVFICTAIAIASTQYPLTL